MRAGDLRGARSVFEETLATMSIRNNGFDGLSYTTPTVQLALADLLWNTFHRRSALAAWPHVR